MSVVTVDFFDLSLAEEEAREDVWGVATICRLLKL